jgi:hypothetical protein
MLAVGVYDFAIGVGLCCKSSGRELESHVFAMVNEVLLMLYSTMNSVRGKVGVV